MKYRRFDIINDLIRKHQYKRYLEIGCNKRERCFDKIEAEYKICVDIQRKAKPDFCMPSNDFFAQNKEHFDVIFIDGLHVCEQVYRDILNSLDILSGGGHIIVHDCNPLEEAHQLEERPTKIWNGTAWKAWVRLRSEREDLSMRVVDIDHGCGVIKKGKQELIRIKDEDLVWENLDQNRQEWLNLVTSEDFRTGYIGGEMVH